jgi:tRNA A37 methylthiotransferase MiaB
MHTILTARAHACTQAIMDAASLNNDGKKRKIVITGCLAQRYSDQLAADLPEADLVRVFVTSSH